jgi:signal transduction histidine kinase
MRLRIASSRRRNALVAVMCFLVLALILGLGSRRYERMLVAESRARVELQLAAYGSALSAAVTQRLALVLGVLAFVQTDGAEDTARFERFAAGICASTPGILHVSLTRDGVIRATYPPDKAHLGLDFARDPRERVRREYLRAVTASQLSIAGPLLEVGSGEHLIHRSLALVAFHAIREGDKAVGAVVLAIDLPPLLREVQVDPMPAGLDLALRDGTGAVFYGSAEVFARDPVVDRIALQDGAWDLAATPHGGWAGSVARPVLLFRVAGLLIGLLISLVVYLVAQGVAARELHLRELAHREAEVWRKAMRVIGHEINNSLAPVTSLVHSAKEMAQRPEMLSRLAPVLDVIGERANHLRTFLAGYTRLARLPAPAKRPVEWKPFLDELALFYPFKLAGSPPSVPAWFDPDQMQQVLINLLKNARESGSPSDQVQLEVARDHEVVISVLDRGPGMKPEDLARAAEPFFTTKPDGTGLGLHLCREVAEAHGGALEILPRLGGGMAIRVHLPA